MKKFRVDIYKMISSDVDEFSSEQEAREFAAWMRRKIAEKDSSTWENYSFEVEELESADE